MTTYAALLGATAPDRQAAVMIGKYSRIGEEAGIEYSLNIKRGKAKEVVEELTKQKLDFTYSKETNEIILVDFDDTFSDESLDLFDNLYKNGKTDNWTRRPIQSDLLGEEEYLGILEEALVTNTGRQGRAEFRNAIEQAIDRLKRETTEGYERGGN